METVNTLLSLVELRMQKDARLWYQQAPFFIQHLQSLGMEEAQLLIQRMFAQYAEQDEEKREELYMLLAQINMFVPGVLAPLWSKLVAKRRCGLSNP